MFDRLNALADRVGRVAEDLRAVAWCAACAVYMTTRGRKHP